jgi:hypothetical protein
MTALRDSLVQELRRQASRGASVPDMLRLLHDRLGHEAVYGSALARYFMVAFDLPLPTVSPIGGWAPDGTGAVSDVRIQELLYPEILHNNQVWSPALGNSAAAAESTQAGSNGRCYFRVARAEEIRKAMEDLGKELSLLGVQTINAWNFPGGQPIDLPTWKHTSPSGPLVVGHGHYNDRYLLYLACEKEIRPNICSTVEVNIADGDAYPQPQVKGRICVDSDSCVWLGRLASGVKVRQGHEEVHAPDVVEHLRDWVHEVSDGRRRSSAILIGKIGPGLIDRLAAFAYEMKAFKRRLQEYKERTRSG